MLRPSGELIFPTNGTLAILCSPDDADEQPGDRLVRDYFGLYRVEWAGEPSVELHLGYGDWIRLLRANGFEIEDLIEVRPPPDATTRFEGLPSAEWSQHWPYEEVWKARKRA